MAEQKVTQRQTPECKVLRFPAEKVKREGYRSGYSWLAMQYSGVEYRSQRKAETDEAR